MLRPEFGNFNFACRQTHQGLAGLVVFTFSAHLTLMLVDRGTISIPVIFDREPLKACGFELAFEVWVHFPLGFPINFNVIVGNRNHKISDNTIIFAVLCYELQSILKIVQVESAHMQNFSFLLVQRNDGQPLQFVTGMVSKGYEHLLVTVFEFNFDAPPIAFEAVDKHGI